MWWWCASQESWKPERCGGALVWCGPTAQVLPPLFNSLVLFATSHWSWHFVEPVWEHGHQTETGEGAAGCGHRLAWSGWFEWRESAEQQQSGSRAARVRAELEWLRGRLDVHVAALERRSKGGERREEKGDRGKEEDALLIP